MSLSHDTTMLAGIAAVGTLFMTGVLFGAGSCTEQPEERVCTLRACGGAPLMISFVDDDSRDVAPSGQWRVSELQGPPRDFDCRSDASRGCVHGVITLGTIPLWPGRLFEVRFNLADGTVSEWQEVLLALTAHTLEDFNGPGCPCTYYEAAAASVVVPPQALWLPSDQHTSGDAGN